MMFFSIAAVALLLDISVSFELIDDDNASRNNPQIPVLNSKFGMKCHTNNLYNAETIKQNVDEAHNNVRFITQLEQGSFTRFPGVVLYSYFIGKSYVAEQVYYASNYIIIDSSGVFVAGMISIPDNDRTAYKVCKFTEGTEYATYRQL
ncbi:Bgt_BCG-7 [Blumeria graminis f. sp. tritici]|uniref:Bgt_BCG-7 n=2 Tax=Blumeria graminis f. sp. tritici TaxID=62690 RepID=A0A061HK55_BLUGR|nr:hypothetical protein BGT96224_BCG7 [Blumeria graminis f. sp. tritici 96224]VCU41360.1 Bgt_BCG-7 [Blumeria graminis f. sp. tritici]